jgi:DNA-binding phage protein
VPAAHIETDWRAVAMFLAGVITEEKPSYATLILQVIADFSKLNTHIAATGGRKE